MAHTLKAYYYTDPATAVTVVFYSVVADNDGIAAVSYTHPRAHDTPEHPVCRLLLEIKNPYIRLLQDS